ncbi:hypothetical protein H1235_07205 [Pseudoxanthomonas sp. NC8]|nr:hypothetical protein H1235_07205 [Pseudoxanthomonas sp. NC8]
MHGFPRHRWLSRLRACLLVVFTLGLVWQSLLGPLGDLHEMMEHGGMEMAHPAGLDIHDEPVHGDATGDDGIPHALLHYAHCCGHVMALPSVAIGCTLPAPAASQPMLHASARSPAAHLSGPFRPPIQA